MRPYVVSKETEVRGKSWHAVQLPSIAPAEAFLNTSFEHLYAQEFWNMAAEIYTHVKT